MCRRFAARRALLAACAFVLVLAGKTLLRPPSPPPYDSLPEAVRRSGIWYFENADGTYSPGHVIREAGSDQPGEFVKFCVPPMHTSDVFSHFSWYGFIMHGVGQEHVVRPYHLKMPWDRPLVPVQIPVPPLDRISGPPRWAVREVPDPWVMSEVLPPDYYIQPFDDKRTVLRKLEDPDRENAHSTLGLLRRYTWRPFSEGDIGMLLHRIEELLDSPLPDDACADPQLESASLLLEVLNGLDDEFGRPAIGGRAELRSWLQHARQRSSTNHH